MEIKRLFQGFLKESPQFLYNLREKNSKTWFEENRRRYEILILEPFKYLVQDLTPFMLSIDSEIEVRPTINKTISRVFRDTRFSKDKSLFRDTMWFVFKRSNPDWKTETHGFFFELSPYGYRYGMGFYSAARSRMDRFRETIDADPRKFLSVISLFTKKDLFILEGNKYKRQIENDHTEIIQEWYQRKSFYLVRNRPIDTELFSSKFVDQLIEHFGILEPLYRYLLED